MGKVKMRNVHDGHVYEFDAGPNNVELRKAIDSGDWTQELSPVQTAVKGVSDWAPPLLTTAGVVAGIPGGPAGMAVGGLQGAGYGATAREIGYNAAGIQKDDRLPQMMGRFAYEGSQGLLSGLAQGVGTPARPGMATSLMKRAVGEAQPEVEQKIIRNGIPVSAAGRRMAQTVLNDLMATKQQILDHWNQAGTTFTWKSLRDAIRGESRRLAQEDVLSTSNEAGLNQALAELEKKLGPVFKGKGPIEDPMQVGEVTLGKAKRVVERPGAKLTPTMLERIRKYADRQISVYERMRMGQNLTEPSPLEYGYRRIADQARSMLNRLSHPATGQTLDEVNQRIGEMRDVGRAVTTQLRRGTQGRDLLSAGVGAATTGGASLWAHDPMRAMLLGIPGAAAGYATSNPELLSKTAIAMSRPSIARGLATQAPVRIADVYARMLGLSNPQAQAGAFGTAKPDGSQ